MDGCRRKLWHLVLGVLVLGAGLVSAQPASADFQNYTANACIEDVWKAHGNTQGLTCTAGDVRVAGVTGVNITQGGSCTGFDDCSCVAVANPPADCATNPNQTGCVTFTALYQIVLGAQARYDVGIYVGTSPNNTFGSKGTSMSGQCAVTLIEKADEVVGGTDFSTAFNPNLNNFVQLDGAESQSTCGDIDATHNPQWLKLTVSTACVAGAGGGLALPNCTSWRQPGSNEQCGALPASDVAQIDAYPGSPSKCNCQPGFTVPGIVVVNPTAAGGKCAVQSLGGCVTVRYQVEVTGQPGGTDTGTNLINLGDSAFGNITAVHAANANCRDADGFGSTVANVCEEVVATTCATGAMTCTTDQNGVKTCKKTCTFDGKICSLPGEHTNQITARIQGNNSGAASNTIWPDNPNLPSCSDIVAPQTPDPGNNCNGPDQGNVTITVNDISGVGGNICPTGP